MDAVEQEFDLVREGAISEGCCLQALLIRPIPVDGPFGKALGSSARRCERDVLTGLGSDGDRRRGLPRGPSEVGYFQLNPIAVHPPIVVGEHSQPRFWCG